MSLAPLRFLHASDFHLEQPLGGVCEVPPSLRSLFLDAPYQAARNVFDAAINEEVDFVLLAGDVVHPITGGPRAIEFLREQFVRLLESEIAVYWIGGRVDRSDRWPQEISLPDNVHHIGHEKPGESEHTRGDEVLATIVAASAAARRTIEHQSFRGHGDSAFRIGLAHGRLDEKAAKKVGVDYWALGSSHEMRPSQKSPVHYCGTPQGRNPRETGAHGCLLVDVEPDRQMEVRHIETDVVRWMRDELEFDSTATVESIKQRLRNRVESLAKNAKGRHVFVSWSISVGGEIGFQLRRGDLPRQLVQAIDTASKLVWTHDIRCQPPALPPDAQSQDTLLGDFLRAVRQMEEQPQGEFASLGESELPDEVIAMLQFTDEQERQAVLRDVATLGIDLLSGDYKPAAAAGTDAA